MKSKKAQLNLDLMDLGLMGGGGVVAGVANKAAAKILPDMGNKAGIAVGLIGGYFLTRTKNRMLQAVGAGAFVRAFGDGANEVGIGDEAISEGLELSEGLEAELAAELAAEMEAELAEGADAANMGHI